MLIRRLCTNYYTRYQSRLLSTLNQQQHYATSTTNAVIDMTDRGLVANITR